MGSESVKVVVRCRPLNDPEKVLGSKMAVSVDPQRCQCFIEKPGAVDEPPKQFTFDGTYFTDQTTEQLYNESAYPLVEGVTEGYNGTIFAYGQTGSGKSFTMQGVSEPPARRGVIPRAFEHVFECIQLKAARLEIRDLRAEFEEERKDYLASVRRLERDGQLLRGLLERMTPLVRRHCDYSSLERLKREAAWDQESATWRFPQVDEDGLKELLDRSDTGNVAHAYFRPKRAAQLLGGGTATGCAGHAPSLSKGPPHPSVNGGLDSVVPRPFRLQSSTVPAASGVKTERKKTKSHQ